MSELDKDEEIELLHEQLSAAVAGGIRHGLRIAETLTDDDVAAIANMAALLAAEVDRLAPGWRVELGDAYVRIPPMPCPRCGELCVFIEWPPQRRMMGAWREVTVETLAAHLGRDGVGDARALRHHDAWRCTAARVVVDLDVL